MTTGLDTGTYEVLRDRLAAQAGELARRAQALNTRRIEQFGSTRLELTGDGRATFLDARGERDHVFPPSHDFEWHEATREDHVLGRHPHVSIEGEVFVETAGGTLTVKIEDNTETGEGIYAEPVDEPLQ